MKVPVVFQSYHNETPNHGYWDYNFIEKLVRGEIWNPVNAVDLVEYNDLSEVPEDTEGIVFIFPARYHIEDIDRINEDLSKFRWVLVLALNDEEGIFPADKLKHKKMKLWQMTPRTGKQIKGSRVIGEGFPPDASMISDYKKQADARPFEWFFSGQITTPRRREMAETLKRVAETSNSLVFNETDGFTKGMPHDEYYRNFASAKVAIAPTGAVTPDSFRLYEALEAGCVPIADDISSVYDSEGFFKMLYSDAPFPILKDYNDLPGYIEDALRGWPMNANKIYEWWQNRKREIVYDFHDDLKDLMDHPEEKSENLRDLITVIIPTSPIKSHPSTKIISETIETVRHHLPDCEIIITFDGVRPEQIDRLPDYLDFMRSMLWKCNFEYDNVLPMIFGEHSHQTGMARKVMEKVKTPLVLYVESDTPLTPDMDIEWQDITKAMLSGVSNMVRFHFESVIPKEHNHMIHGMDDYQYVPLLRTSQWSQRPHLATTAFYRRILRDYFSENAKSFIEDKMHGILHEAYVQDGILGWQQFKVHIYAPEGNFKRSYHTDGREGGAKYDDTQVF